MLVEHVQHVEAHDRSQRNPSTVLPLPTRAQTDRRVLRRPQTAGAFNFRELVHHREHVVAYIQLQCGDRVPEWRQVPDVGAHASGAASHERCTPRPRHIDSVVAANAGERFVSQAVGLVHGIRLGPLSLFVERFRANDSELLWIAVLDSRFSSWTHLSDDQRRDVIRAVERIVFQVVQAMSVSGEEARRDDLQELQQELTLKKMKEELLKALFSDRVRDDSDIQNDDEKA